MQSKVIFCVAYSKVEWAADQELKGLHLVLSQVGVKIWKSFNPSWLHIFIYKIKYGLVSGSVCFMALVPFHELFVTGP